MRSRHTVRSPGVPGHEIGDAVQAGYTTPVRRGRQLARASSHQKRKATTGMAPRKHVRVHISSHEGPWKVQPEFAGRTLQHPRARLPIGVIDRQSARGAMRLGAVVDRIKLRTPLRKHIPERPVNALELGDLQEAHPDSALIRHDDGREARRTEALD
jgi:hypothetical protein